jgi:hypothetical protein
LVPSNKVMLPEFTSCCTDLDKHAECKQEVAMFML